MSRGPIPGVVLASLLAVGAVGWAPDGGLRERWSAPVGLARHAPVIAVHAAGDLLLVSDARGGVSALHARDGRLAWFVQHTGPVVAPPGATTSAPEGDAAPALALTAGDRVVLVDAITGARRRTFQLPSPLARGAVCDDARLYAPLLLDHAVQAVELDSGRDAWTLRLPAPLAAPLLGLGPAGLVAWLEDGTLRGFAPGPLGARAVWSRREGRPAGPPVVDGAQVLIATDARALTALDSASGRVAWRWSAPEDLRGGPIPAGEVVLVAGETSSFAVRRGRDGGLPEIAWRVAGETVVARLGASVALRDAHGAMLRRDAATGTRLAGGAPTDVRWAGNGLAVSVDGDGRVHAWTESR